MTIASIREISRLVAGPPEGRSIPQAHQGWSDPLPTCSQALCWFKWPFPKSREPWLARTQLWPCCGVMRCFLHWKALFRSLEGLEKKADKEDLLLLVWS